MIGNLLLRKYGLVFRVHMQVGPTFGDRVYTFGDRVYTFGDRVYMTSAQ